jgi:hypothetical protein
MLLSRFVGLEFCVFVLWESYGTCADGIDIGARKRIPRVDATEPNPQNPTTSLTEFIEPTQPDVRILW